MTKPDIPMLEADAVAQVKQLANALNNAIAAAVGYGLIVTPELRSAAVYHPHRCNPPLIKVTIAREL